jgi:hypothetical protein
MLKKILQKALKPKSTIKKINERLKKAKQTKGIKGAKEEFKARDEKKAFEKRQTEALKKRIAIKEAKEKAERKGKGAIKSKKETSFKDAARVKKGLRIKVGGKGKDAKAKPVGTPTQRAKGDTISSLKSKMLKAKTYKQYEALRDKLKKLEKLKADRQFGRLSKKKQFEKMEDDYMQSRIDSYGDPEMMKSKLAKGGMTMAMKKKTKYMAKGGMKKTKYMAKGGMKKTKYMAKGGATKRK